LGGCDPVTKTGEYGFLGVQVPEVGSEVGSKLFRCLENPEIGILNKGFHDALQ
jgi:hypothetical protein